MNVLSSLRRAVAPLLLSAALAGCGGGGGGGSTPLTPAAKSAKAFKNANVEGAFDTPDRAVSRAGSTSCTIQFTNSNGGDTGSATFTSGTAADGTFMAYGASVSGLAFDNQTYDAATQIVSGTVQFDLSNFTPNKIFKTTAKFTGTYTVDSKFHPNLTGKITGADGTIVNLSLGYQLGASAIDLSGTYSGTISYQGLPIAPFKNLVLTNVSGDQGRIKGTIPFTLPTGTSTNLDFDASYTRSAVAGGFNLPADVPAVITTLKAGSPAQVYLSTTDEGKNIAGTLVIVNNGTGGDGVTYAFALAAKKGAASGGGGSSTNLATGYYDGGVLNSSGQNTGYIAKLNVVKNSATVGANGAMILSSSAAPSIGGRIASVTGSGNTIAITVDKFTSTYTKWVLNGTISGSTLNLTWTATLLDGTTESGKFDSLGKVDLATSTLNGTYTGTLTGTSDSTSTPFTGVVKSAADGTVTITTNSKILNGTITLPTITGYVAGTSIAVGDASETALPSPYTGSTLYGNYGGEITNSGAKIDGNYVLFIQDTGGHTPYVQYGKLSLTKS